MTAGSVAAAPASAVWYRDPRIRSLIFQAVALVLVIWVGWYLASNTVENMARQGIASGFGFLENTAGFAIIQSLIPYSETSSYGIALLVSLLNTILIAFVGIILSHFHPRSFHLLFLDNFKGFDSNNFKFTGFF